TSTGWTYFVAVPTSAIQASADDFRRSALLAALVAVLFSGLLAMLFARPIARALAQVTQAALAAARGDLDQRVEVRGGGEIGRMADAFRSLVDHHRQLAANADAIAGGDLTRKVTPASERDMLGHA